MPEAPSAVVFDIGRVLFDWNLRYLFEKLIDGPAQLDWFLAHVVSEEWHFTHRLVRQLHGAGVPLYALTNFGAEFFAGFRSTEPIFELFDDIVVSGEEGVAKPDPRIYAIAEQRFGHPPQALFFTDDNPANVAAAAARGWRAHLFTDATALERELASAGLIDRR